MKKSSRTINARIHRINGQLLAIEEMIKSRRSCLEILQQISAVKSGLEQVAVYVFQSEIHKMTNNKKLTSEEVEKLSQAFHKLS